MALAVVAQLSRWPGSARPAGASCLGLADLHKHSAQAIDLGIRCRHVPLEEDATGTPHPERVAVARVLCGGAVERGMVAVEPQEDVEASSEI